MHDFNASVVAAVVFQLFFHAGGVPDEIELGDVGVLLQGHDRAADYVGRPKVATHGVQRDFHRSGILRISGRECKIKKQAVISSEAKRSRGTPQVPGRVGPGSLDCARDDVLNNYAPTLNTWRPL